ncbi:hypothetical protein, partial [Xenorhabdus griffiniae]|uniref:hypothetical protein n=1 Tax=Xenorhabdus griffiniae TaxID=351672 RepID=UPI001675BE18
PKWVLLPRITTTAIRKGSNGGDQSTVKGKTNDSSLTSSNISGIAMKTQLKNTQITIYVYAKESFDKHYADLQGRSRGKT